MLNIILEFNMGEDQEWFDCEPDASLSSSFGNGDRRDTVWKKHLERVAILLVKVIP